MFLKSIDIKEILNNKMVKMMLIVISVVVIIIVGVCIFFAIRGIRLNSYVKLENTILNAGKNYYRVHQDQLPIEVGAVASVDNTTLSSENFMKELANISPSGSECSAKVSVKNVNGNYIYYADLNCGDKYKSETLADGILKNSQIVAAGDGLYENNGDYVYRGEMPSNYINFADRLYRIVSINSDKTINVIAADYERNIVSVSWDDRYNIDKGYNVGINDFSLSRIKDSLNSFINNSDYFNDVDKSKMMYQNLCIGRVGFKNPITRNVECSQTYDNQIIGLLPISNYVYASLDSNCKTPYDESCQNYNYLALYGQNWWTLTSAVDNSYQVYYVSSSGSVDLNNCFGFARMREVVKLTDLLGFKGGIGTIEDPFEIK